MSRALAAPSVPVGRLVPAAPLHSKARRAPGGAPSYAATGMKLGRAVLAYVAAVILVITLQPFQFRVPGGLTLTWWATDAAWFGAFDAVANVALFLPLGFLGALTHAAGAGGRHRRLTAALLGGALLSLAVETVQVFEPGRYPSPTDVATNAFGAWLGAWLHGRSERHLGADSRLVGRLALELPVMGLVYVALPLLTLAGLTSGAGVSATRALGLVLLGGFGGALLGTVQRRHFGPRGAVTPAATAGAAALWFAAGALPALATAPRAYAAGAMLAAGVAWLVGRPGAEGLRAIERRFEAEALGRAAPWLAGYLLLLPLGDAAERAWGKLSILRDLEFAAAFAVLGYVLAEAWGRREWRYRRTVRAVAPATGATALVLGVVEAAGGGAGRGAGAWAVLALTACYGGWIYHLQRAHVRALVEARRGAPAASDVAPNGRAARTVEARAA